MVETIEAFLGFDIWIAIALVGGIALGYIDGYVRGRAQVKTGGGG